MDDDGVVNAEPIVIRKGVIEWRKMAFATLREFTPIV
jgi:hypothetical protein